MNRVLSILTIFALAVISSSSVFADLSEELKVGPYTLKLNGQGTRSKAFMQIYESGLYLLTPTQSSKVILETDELMAIRIRITSGFVSRESLSASLQESLVKATGGHPETIAQETQLLIGMLKDEVKKNDVFDFLYAPNQGLFVIKNGVRQGIIPGLAFKKAFFGVWLSETAVDKDLRQAMLTGSKVR